MQQPYRCPLSGSFGAGVRYRRACATGGLGCEADVGQQTALFGVE